jgi:hypothetical protein
MPKLRQDLVERAQSIIQNACNTGDLRSIVAGLVENLRDAPEPVAPGAAAKKHACALCGVVHSLTVRKKKPAVGAVKKHRVVTKSKSGKKAKR